MLDIKGWLLRGDFYTHILIQTLISNHVFLRGDSPLNRNALDRSNIDITERFQIPVLNIQQIQDIHTSIVLIPRR